MPKPFHLAIPVDNLERCSRFYNDILDFVPEMPKQVWVNDITSNVTGVSIVLNP